jgi:8-oxo-dGTP diphosphatase
MSGSDFERPILTVDTVILTLIQGVLHALLVQRTQAPEKDTWTLPGGFVHTNEDEDAESAARRVLSTKAGVSVRHLEQLYTFSGKRRDKRGWSASIVYLALVQSAEVSEMSERARWVPVSQCKHLPFDHTAILTAGLHRVRDKASYSSLPALLLPEVFTLSQLQRVYEQVLGVALNAAAFRRKIETQDLVELADAPKESGKARGRPAQYYRLREDRLVDLGRVLMLPDARRGG